MIYVCHPYAGKASNKRKIALIIKKLVRQSINSVYISPLHAFGYMYKVVDWQRGMDMCLKLLGMCNSAIFCYGWKNSKGCNIEMEYCREMHIPYIIIDKKLHIIGRSSYSKNEMEIE